MEAQKLIDLWDALTERRNVTQIIDNTRPEDSANAEARSALVALDERVTVLQQDVWNVYPSKYVRCRDIGHVWDVQTEVLDGESKHLLRTITCYRCLTTRKDELGKDGMLLGRSYIHQDDYLMPKGAYGVRYGKAFWRGLTYMVVSRQGQ